MGAIAAVDARSFTVAGTVARCEQCHVYQQASEPWRRSTFAGLRQDLREGRRLNPLAPPVIPHRFFMGENCQACHAGPAAREEIRTDHPERPRCRQCHLEWKDPLFASVVLAMVIFGVGGFGGAINAAFAMNTMVHNTAWIMGHLHLTVGTATALTFMGVSYWLLPRLVGRELAFKPLATLQPYLWFLGMILFAVVNHVTGIMGMPRRVFSGQFQGSPVAEQWQGLTTLSAYGGIVLFVSSFFFLVDILGTLMAGKKIEPPSFDFALPVEGPPKKAGLWDRFGLWTILAIVLILLAYAYPIMHLYGMERFGSVGFKPF